MLGIEANKAIVRRYFETFNSGHLEQLHEILAQDYGDRLEGSVGRHRRHPQLPAAAVWLCSPEASYVFRQMLIVDGGMTIGGCELS